MMKRVATIFAVMTVLLLLNTTWADDYNPPPWAGEERVTRQVWEFGTGLNPSPPDIDENPMGIASLTVTGDDALWKPFDPDPTGELGIWKFEDQIVITIPDYIEPYPLKEIWVELTYTASGEPDVWADDPAGTTFWGDLIDSKPAGGVYVHATWQIFMQPNPEFETIYIEPRDCTTFVDEIVIYTICTVPEPATVCLLALGGLVLLRKRKP